MEKKCKTCRRKFKFSPSQDRIYCSVTCYSRKNHGMSNGNWRGGFIHEPWYNRLVMMKQRCENPKSKDFHRYGGRGIKLLLTKEQMQFLWRRDKADSLDQPTIDRIDNDGHYSLENCRFVENSANSKKGSK